MHEAVRRYVRHRLPAQYKKVIEVGSLDINGGVRDLLDDTASYLGVDLQAGPNVGRVDDFATYLDPHPADLVLCLEVLEHTSDWREIIAAAARNLQPGGTLLVTCATTGRPRHSARSERPIEPDEFYENVSQADLDEELGKHFGDHGSEVVGLDLRAWAIRAGGPVVSKTLILVIGCGRSGTSAVTGCLHAMGANTHESILIAEDNPRGFWENQEVVALHDRLLARCSASWDHPAPSVLMPSAMDAAQREMAAIIHNLPGPVCAIKDPRASLFVDLWARACELEGVRLCVLEVRRDPDAVAASLSAREGWGEKRSRNLIAHYTGAIDRARAAWGPRTWEWQTIRFPEELQQRYVWQGIFGGFAVDAEVDMEILGNFFDPRLIHHGVDTPPLWSVIIPSRDDEKVLDCVASLIESHPEIEANQIVIVDDGLSRHTKREFRGVTWVKGEKPFVFARAVNMGAAAMDPASDLVILGDDVRIETPRALDRLAAASAGAAAAAPEVVGVCGQPAQQAGAYGNEADWLAFICVYIPRRVWTRVGELDERFIGYGYDDVDWCKRACPHGQLRIAHDVRVVHTHDSSYRNQADWKTKYAENRVRFEEKWRPREVA